MMYLYKTLVSFLVALSLIAGCANAAQQPTDIRNACDGLASATYGLKDLVLSMNSTSKSGNLKVRSLAVYPFSPASSLRDVE